MKYLVWEMVALEEGRKAIPPMSICSLRTDHKFFANWWRMVKDRDTSDWPADFTLDVKRDGPLSDVLMTVQFYKFVSPRLKEYISLHAPGDVEFLPVSIRRSSGEIIQGYSFPFPLHAKKDGKHRICKGKSAMNLAVEERFAKELLAEDFRGLRFQRVDPKSTWLVLETLQGKIFLDDVAFQKSAEPGLESLVAEMLDPSKPAPKVEPSMRKIITACCKQAGHAAFKDLLEADFEKDLAEVEEWMRKTLAQKQLRKKIRFLCLQVTDDVPPHKLCLYGVDTVPEPPYDEVGETPEPDVHEYISGKFASPFLKLHARIYAKKVEDKSLDEETVEGPFMSIIPRAYCGLLALHLFRKLDRSLVLGSAPERFVAFAEVGYEEMHLLAKVTSKKWMSLQK